MTTPLPEWAPHEALWIGFPSDRSLWAEDLGPGAAGSGRIRPCDSCRRPRRSGVAGRGRRSRRDDCAASWHRSRASSLEPFGDIWLRDTGPIVTGSGATRRAQGFGFNGWGGKYDLPGDEDIGERLAAARRLSFARADWVLEGGAIDGDGIGQLSSPPSNACSIPTAIPASLARKSNGGSRAISASNRVVWLGEGLAERSYRRPCRQSRALRRAGAGRDPDGGRRRSQRARLHDAARAPGGRRARGRHPPLARPGRARREIVPASYMNFYIGNAAVVVPQYGAPNDEAAVAVVQALFPDRRRSACAPTIILTGGGSFHCITQQVPRMTKHHRRRAAARLHR